MNKKEANAWCPGRMSAEELRSVVAQLGGRDAVAQRIHRAPSTITGWLYARDRVPLQIGFCLRQSVAVATAAPEDSEELRKVEAAMYASASLDQEHQDRRRHLGHRRGPAGMSIEELRSQLDRIGGRMPTARALGCSPSTIHAWLTGSTNISPAMSERIRAVQPQPPLPRRARPRAPASPAGVGVTGGSASH